MKKVLAVALITLLSATAWAADGTLKFRIEIKSADKAGATTSVLDANTSTLPGLPTHFNKSTAQGVGDLVSIAPPPALSATSTTAPQLVTVGWNHARMVDGDKLGGSATVERMESQNAVLLLPGKATLINTVPDKGGSETTALYVTLVTE